MKSYFPFCFPLRNQNGRQFLLKPQGLTLLLPLVFFIHSFNVVQAQCDITLTPTNIVSASCGGNDGSFQVQVSGITAPYQYALSKLVNDNYVQQENGTLIAGTLTFVSLSAGTYKVDISKDGTCSNSVTVILEQTELVLTPINIKQPSCGGNDGSFQVQVTGTNAPYQYVLSKLVNGDYVQQENGTLIAGTPTFIFLGEGMYKVDISKGGTCSGSVTVTLEQTELVLTPINIKQPSCGGNDGSFQVQVTGTNAPYQYVLSKLVNGDYVQQENGTLIAGTPTFIFLGEGVYKVDISKGGTCSGSVTVTLEQTELVLTPINIKQPSCGGNDGSFQVQVTGPVTPYQYVLSKLVNGDYVQQENGTLIAGTPTFIFLGEGVYKVDISKGGTCSGSVTVTLEQTELVLTPINIKQPSCGGNDGSFQVQVTGPVTPYQYVLSKLVNGDYVQQENGTLIAGTPTFIFLGEGKYKVDISKGGTCSGSVTVTLEQPPLSMSLASLTSPSCGGSNGSFQVATTGIALPYPYQLFKQVNGNFTQVQSGTLLAGTLGFAGLTEGVYRVFIEKGSCSGSLDVYVHCETIGKQGCGPGYWKNATGAWVLTNYHPSQTVESVFDVPDAYNLDQMTLLEALQGGGESGTIGSAKILLRAATASVLNAAHRDVAYSVLLQFIISKTNAALASGKSKTMEQLAQTFDKYNNFQCPLQASEYASTQHTGSPDQSIATVDGLRLKIMPNPSPGLFNVVIDSKSSLPATLRVIDIQGRLVEYRPNIPARGTVRIGEKFIPGIYLLEVIQGTERKQVKLIKTN